MPRLCLLTVHAHPDDESSKGAGTVARYHAEGVHTVLVCCTGGEAGDVLNPAMDRPEVRDHLAEVRLGSSSGRRRSSATTSWSCSATATRACPTRPPTRIPGPSPGRRWTRRSAAWSPSSAGPAPGDRDLSRRAEPVSPSRSSAGPRDLRCRPSTRPATPMPTRRRGALGAAQALLHDLVAPAHRGHAREVPRAGSRITLRRGLVRAPGRATTATTRIDVSGFTARVGDAGPARPRHPGRPDIEFWFGLPREVSQTVWPFEEYVPGPQPGRCRAARGRRVCRWPRTWSAGRALRPGR